MALYKDGRFLIQENGPEYDLLHGPVTATPLSGIYRCDGCGASAVSTTGHPLPPQNHHQHTAAQGTVRRRWCRTGRMPAVLGPRPFHGQARNCYCARRP